MPLKDLKGFRQILLNNAKFMDEVGKVLWNSEDGIQVKESKVFSRAEGKKLFLKMVMVLDNDSDPDSRIFMNDEFEFDEDSHRLLNFQRSYEPSADLDPSWAQVLGKLRASAPPSLQSWELKNIAKGLVDALD